MDNTLSQQGFVVDNFIFNPKIREHAIDMLDKMTSYNKCMHDGDKLRTFPTWTYHQWSFLFFIH